MLGAEAVACPILVDLNVAQYTGAFLQTPSVHVTGELAHVCEL